ncbi:hypothetical protein [Luteimonas fraxinea]|uniref:hypothetical protein n=1 Tax=Luteimonas fraxinea TaxID=2901869 RepID=UPI001E3446FD|nr:hypothetical protein [Luteimonas fraxinea]MCD9125591.1 hypothetical protein [Luteimonas fraxinea]
MRLLPAAGMTNDVVPVTATLKKSSFPRRRMCFSTAEWLVNPEALKQLKAKALDSRLRGNDEQEQT